MKAFEDTEAVSKTLFAAGRSTGDVLRRRRRTGAGGNAGTLTPVATPLALDMAAAPSPTAAAATSIGVTARHAIERTLQHVRSTAIGAIGLHTSALVEWLRRTGRSADALPCLGTHDGQHSVPSRPTKRWPVIVAVDCIEYAPDPAHVLRELKRMLTRDGQLIVVVPNVTHASSRLAMLRGHFPLPGPSAPAAKHPFTATEIEGLLEDAGLVVIGVERQLDPVEILKELGADVPEPVLAVLADDADALTSHFAILAGPQTASATRLLHRRVRELAFEQHAAARTTGQLVRRLAQLEGRNSAGSADTAHTDLITSMSWTTSRPGLDHRDVEVDGLGAAVTDLQQGTRSIHEFQERTRTDAANAQAAIERLDQELRTTTERLAARDRADAEREDGLRRACEPLLASVAELKSLIARIEKSRYRRLVARVRELVNDEVTRGSIIAVITRGDHELLAFDRREGWHFPQTEAGVYAGHHPADSNAAIRHLEHVRVNGARYLLIPRTSFWWLEHYREFNEHLLRRYRCVLRDERTCVLFALAEAKASALRRRAARETRRRLRRAR